MTYSRRVVSIGAEKIITTAVLFLTVSLGVFAQSFVKGKVTDPSGNPIPGVSVFVQGTSNGTLTDTSGEYSLRAVDGDTIEFNCLGLPTLTHLYDGRARLDVVMTEDAMYLDDVVVVGYGTARKGTLTSAVSAIKGDELLKAPSTNVSQVLGGKLPGISSVQESGEPGLDQASLRIRGSVYGVAYVVDGFPVSDINDIDPADIESISVLKDGASASVYGLSAAGGVIIITTRKGEAGKAKITYNGSYGVSMNANFPKFMDGPQFATYYNRAQMMDQLASGAISDASEYVPYFTEDNIRAMLNGDPSDGWDNVNYIGKVFGTGITNKHNVTVQGGNDGGRYFVSAGYLGQDGNIDGYDYQRYNIRANIESRISDNILFNAGLSGTVGNRVTPRFLSGGSDQYFGYEVGWFSVAHQTIGMWPFLPEKTEDGYYSGAIPANQVYPDSPLAALYESGTHTTKSFNGVFNASLTWNLPWIKGLSLKASGSYDWSNSYNKNVDTPYYVKARIRGEDGTWYWSAPLVDVNGTSTGVQVGEGSVYSKTMTGQASVNYTGTFGNHNVEAMALGELRDYESNSLAAYAQNLPFALLPELSNGTPSSSVGPISGGSSEARSAGFVARLRYDYAEKYLLELTGRYDGSYKFAGMTSTRWGFFPSASVGWNISKEDFMKSLTAIDNLKIRGSVGLLGNDGVSPFMFLSTYSPGGKVVLQDGTAVPSYYTSGVPNKNLTWEKTLSWNAGYDLSLWNEKLGMEVDAFYNYTYDILTGNSGGHPASMGGYYETYVNGNAIDSKGIDILISHKNRFELAGQPFYYEIGATATYSKTRWIRYKDDPNVPEWQKITGTTYGSLWGWLADGLYRSEEEIDNSAWYGTRPNVGDIKYVDLNGDGLIDWQDRGIFGKSNRPELTFGLNVNIGWNGFDFNAQFTGGALFQVSMTGTYFNENDDDTIWTKTFKEGANSPLYLVENAWSPENPDGTFPRLTLSTAGHGGDNGLSSSFWWKDGKYIRLKTAQLGYTIPQKLTKRLGVESLRIFIEGNNLFTLDGLPDGIDPESPGVNNGYYPQQRFLMGGITLTL